MRIHKHGLLALLLAGIATFGQAQSHQPGVPAGAPKETIQDSDAKGFSPSVEKALQRARAKYFTDVSLLDYIHDVLLYVDGGTLKGTSYTRTFGNAFSNDWLLQTPNWWGKSAASLPNPATCSGCEMNTDFDLPYCKDFTQCTVGTCRTMQMVNFNPATTRYVWPICAGHSESLVEHIYDNVIGAQRVVDIATLDEPTGSFRAALANALGYLARKSKTPIDVRVLVGKAFGATTDPPFKDLLLDLTRYVRDVPDGKVRVSVAMGAFTFAYAHWNHSKIVATDDRVIAGGHNLWDGDYLRSAPIHDVSIDLKGPAAASAHRFLSPIWAKACTGLGLRFRYDPAKRSTHNGIEKGCWDTVQIPDAPGTGDVKVLAVGNYASGIVPSKEHGDISTLARVTAFRRATSVIRISQQDLTFVTPPAETFQALADAVVSRSVHVYIVMTNPGATSGLGTPYSNGSDSFDVAKALWLIASGPAKTKEDLDKLRATLCDRVHLTTLRFSNDDTWSGGRNPGNHAKVWVVDDKIFYVGSDNIYPADLQEFGYIVESPAAMKTFLDDYWNPLWAQSSRVAVSGTGVDKCDFRLFPDQMVAQ